jgi:sec-independent protein translocase protein TatB
MFDIGFFELALIAVVALFVVGPERLPGLVRSVGFWVGKARYFVNNMNDEMKREMHNAEILRREAEATARQQIEEPSPKVDDASGKSS